MDAEEIRILDMLRHFWYVKSYIPDKLLEWSLSQFNRGKNPFLGKLGDHLRQDPRAQNGINFQNPIFIIKLEND